ncbi:hypothetical protein HZA33_00315 [Candidatus Pacearchaeota archaeon]|nr:hypothetical protein [Candidatus Pacearchaeota archaeon]
MANSKSRRVKLRLLEKQNKPKSKGYTFFLLIALLLLVGILIISFSKMGSILNQRLEGINGEEKQQFPAFVIIDGATLVSMEVPAVDSSGKGVATILAVESMPGSGRTLVDIDNLLFWSDTQQSMRVARLVAANITGKDINKYDLVYNVYANASLVGGPSAGAALTLTTIAALENKQINKSVMITGSINHDGTIGPVGGILEKAKAAKDINATLFLVPLLQSRDVIYETKEHCEKFGPAQVCTTETIPRKINVENEAGLQVLEVGTIKEAMQYILL